MAKRRIPGALRPIGFGLSIALACMGCDVLTALSSLAKPAPNGQLGDPAPPLDIAEWVKGGPVTLEEGKGEKVYVVEFWATWCPPCLTSVPHLTELQKTHKDDGLVVVGISDEAAATVKTFADEMGDRMDYVVAADKNNRTTAAYLGAFGVKGIPHAFVVDKSGAIVWHGHPMGGLDVVISKVLAEEFDARAAQRLADDFEKLPRLFGEYTQLARDGTDTGRADAIGERVLEAGGGFPPMLNELAWFILTEPNLKHRNLDFAFRAAEAAYAATDGKDAAIADTYARAFYEKGDLAEAIKYQQKAVELLRSAPPQPPEAIQEIEATLKKYQAEARGEN